MPNFTDSGAIITPGVDLALNNTNPRRPQFQVLDGSNIFDPTAYSISEVQNVVAHTSQLSFQGAAPWLGATPSAGISVPSR